jgi:hypothetical protein
MGSLIKIWKTIVLPEGAAVKRDGTVTWTVKGKKRTGKMTSSGKGWCSFDNDPTFDAALYPGINGKIVYRR